MHLDVKGYLMEHGSDHCTEPGPEEDESDDLLDYLFLCEFHEEDENFLRDAKLITGGYEHESQ